MDASSPTPRQWLTYPLKHYTPNDMVTTDTGGLHDLSQAQVSHHEARETGNCGPQIPKVFLCNVHEEAGHQGSDRTLARLVEVAYWVGMGCDAAQHCRTCVKHQITTSPACKPASLQPVLASQLWDSEPVSCPLDVGSPVISLYRSYRHLRHRQ